MSRLSAIVVALVTASGCRGSSEPHEHASEHPEGHDHHAEGHGHGEGPVVRVTLWSDRFELFAEHAPVVAGASVEVLAHLTVLDGFRALDAGAVELEIDAATPVRARAEAPTRPGIYALTFAAPPAGTYRGRVRVSGPDADVIEGLALVVHADAASARAAAPHAEEDDESTVELLKEQQWGLPFRTAFAEKGSLVAAIEVAGTIETPPGGSAAIGAPVAGRVVPGPKGLPRPGKAVTKGELLASFAPAPASPEEAARAGLAVAEAEARAQAAASARDRAERLIRDQAISQREVEDARREADVAGEALRAARRARSLFAGSTGGSGGGSWRLVSPITGTLVDVAAAPGATVAAGEVLFRVVDTRELWVHARVPEQDAVRLRSDRDAAFQLSGAEDWIDIDVTGPAATASIVTIGRTVDASSRTVDVIYALGGGDARLRVGGLARVSLPVGEDFSGVVVARDAVVDDDGRSVVYVQRDGEHFEARQVRLGPRAAARVAVVAGLEAGERVVSRGAHLVRLASGAADGPAHGHIH